MDINGRSVKDVLEQFDFRAENDKKFKGFYKVTASKQTKFSNTDDDLIIARLKLEQNLTAAQLTGNTSIFSICFYNRLDKNGELAGEPEVFNVRLNNPNDYVAAAPAPTSGVNAEILRELQTINGRLTALEEPEEEDDDEPDDDSIFGMINGLPPETKQQLLITGLSQLFGIKQPGATINGVPGENTTTTESDKIKNALKIMAQHTPNLGDDLQKLAHIAETNPAQFKMLLSMLRNG